MSSSIRFLFILFSAFPSVVFASDFTLNSCEFTGSWEQITASTFSTEITYDERLFTLLESQQNLPASYIQYKNTFRVFNISSPIERLTFSKSLWVTDGAVSADYNGILLTIDSILTGRLGNLKNISCIEWGLFKDGAKYHGFDLNTPVYLETSWSIWRKQDSLKIIMELGEMVSVKPNSAYFDKLYADGWVQINDLHNHPALQKSPSYKGKDLGPNLFPSPEDTRFWDSTLKWGNKNAAIIDGLSSLQVSSDEFSQFQRQYYCSKYPTSFYCK